MTYDFHARFAFALQHSVVQESALQWLDGETERLPDYWQDIQIITDPVERLHVLAQALLVGGQRERARSGTRMQSGGYRFWVEQHAADFLHARRAGMQEMGLEPALPDLALFPANSWALQIPFTLRKSYVSKDDTSFHLLDNPLKKEWVFKVPYVAASQWKGTLRAALVQQLAEWWTSLSAEAHHERQYRKRFLAWRIWMTRLFGTEKGVLIDDQEPDQYLDQLCTAHAAHWYRRYVRRFMAHRGFLAGRLHFFPTFFDRIGLEVINPHNRETGTGERGPILLESVPSGATGTLVLLYVPSGHSGDWRQAAQDLELTATGLQAMLTIYGFGAKTSSGFGVVAEQLAGQGQLLIRTALPASTNDQSAHPVEPELPDLVQSFQARYPAEDFSLKPKEWREKHRVTRREQEEYKDARAAFAKYQQEFAAYHQQVIDRHKPAADTPPSPPSITAYTFTTLNELQALTQQVTRQLQEGGAG